MTLKTSKNGRKFIASFEEEVLEVYLDPVGLPTVGVGHLVTKDEREKYPVGKKISKEESDRLFAKDLYRFEKCVDDCVGDVTQNQFDAMVSLAFNIGELNFKKSSVLKYFLKGDFAKSADAFLSWNKSKGRVLAGLTRRRKAERTIFLTPSAAAPVNEDPPTKKDTTEAQPAPEAANDPAPQQQKPILDRFADKVEGFRSTIKRMGEDPDKISFSSLVLGYGKQAIGYIVIGIGWLKDNPLYMLVGFGLLCVGAYLWSRSKDRRDKRVLGNITQKTTVNVESK